MELNMEQKVAVFKALGNKTRFLMFKAIFTKSVTCSIDDKKEHIDEAEAESICVSTIASLFDYSMPTISNHLKELRTAGLITMEKRGNKIYVEANLDTIKALNDCFTDLIVQLDAARLK